jgi:hypothetical protein
MRGCTLKGKTSYSLFQSNLHSLTLMADTLDLLPNEKELSRPLFASDEEYAEFRENFIETVAPQHEEWQEVRRKSEEDAHTRLLR